MILLTVLILGEIFAKRIKMNNISKEQLSILLLIGIFGSSFNYFMQLGFSFAPNVGFINAANASSISVLTLLSVYFFKDELNKRNLLGIIMVTLVLVMLVI